MKLVRELIQFDSRTGHERKIQDFIESYFLSYNLTVYKTKGNLLAKIDGKDSNRAFIFNAHVDTVSPGNLSLWHHDPFSGKVIGDKMYGLGASDEKAGVASVMLLAKHFSKTIPACDMWFMFVVNEEIDGSGTQNSLRYLISKQKIVSQYRDIAGILVEPTCLKEVEMGHKGNAFILLTVFGDSGHGSRPDKLKTNAVVVMSEIIQKLKKLNAIWDKKYIDPVLGIPTIGIGTSIRAGDKSTPNKFPDTCELTLDIRTIPAMHNKVLRELKHFLKAYPVDITLLYEPAPYGLTPENDSIVQAVKSSIPEIIVTTSEGSTDQCFFTQRGIPAVILGPGEKTTIHKPNEYCILSNIQKAVKLYESIVIDWAKRVSN